LPDIKVPSHYHLASLQEEKTKKGEEPEWSHLYGYILTSLGNVYA